MFIITSLALFTLPFISRQGQSPGENTTGPRVLAGFIESLKQNALKKNQTLILHLDIVNRRIWVTDQTSGQRNEAEETPMEIGSGLEKSLGKLIISSIELLNDPEPDPEDSRIRIYSQGHSDMALIHFDQEDLHYTLKLHPFLLDVEIIQGDISFNDCI